MYFGGGFSHAVVKRPADRDFRVQHEHGGRTEAAEPPPDLLLFCERLWSRLPAAPVFARVDAVLCDSGPVLMELELIEPELFVTMSDGAVDRLAAAIRGALPGDRGRI